MSDRLRMASELLAAASTAVNDPPARVMYLARARNLLAEIAGEIEVSAKALGRMEAEVARAAYEPEEKAK